MLRPLITLFAVLVMPLIAWAQPLSDRVPADAILYVGWQGSQSLGPDYENSHLKAILDNSNIPELFSELLPRIILRTQRDEPQLAKALALAQAIGQPLWQHPSAFFISGLEFPPGAEPYPKLAIICRAGQDADAVFARFNELAALPPQHLPIQVHRIGGDVAISFGFPPDANPLAGQGTATKSISTSEQFTQTLAQVHKQPLAIAYLNNQALLDTLNEGVKRATASSPDNFAAWEKARDALGFNGIKSFIWTGAFDNADWSTQSFLSAPAPRKGLLTLLDRPPVSDDLLRSIPSTANWMLTLRFDPARLLNEIRSTAAQIDPQLQTGFDQVMGIAQLMLAMNVQKDLLEPLGDQWALYRDPSNTGVGPLGIVMINRLDRPEDAQRAFAKLDLFIENMANAQLARNRMRISFERTRVDDLTIHYLSLPLISPSWAVKDTTLYVGLYPQAVVAAAQPQPKSILDNPQFQAIRQRLGVQNASAWSFTDVSDVAEHGYQSLLAFSQLAFGMLQMAGIEAPPMVLPPLGSIRQHLTPAASAAWTDDAGWHRKSIRPFPGTPLLGFVP